MISVEIIIPLVIVRSFKPSYWRDTNLKIGKINCEHLCSNIVPVLLSKKISICYHCEIRIGPGQKKICVIENSMYKKPR